MELKEALVQLRSEKERKFNQTVDLIVNLKGLDFRKTNISVIVNVPHKIKEKRVCAFLNTKSDLVNTITKPEFARFSDKKLLKNLVKDYDYFIAHAPLMPAVATAFGKVLGPSGKMPSPQLGVMMQDTPEEIKKVLSQISKSAKIRVREGSVKIAVGKTEMKDEIIIENIKSIYEGLVNALPTKRDNVKNVLIKFTMTKPVEVQVK
jgi:large subunit ribosomal protein L1